MKIFNRIRDSIATIFSNKSLFVPHYQDIVNKMATGELLTPSHDRYSIATIRNYNVSIGWLQTFEQENGRIYLGDISSNWAEKYAYFLIKSGLSKNSVANLIARLKAIIRRLSKSELIVFNGSGISCYHELSTTIYSSLDDIRQLLQLDLSGTPGLARVRNVYVIQCFLGLRFSDLKILLKNPQQYLRIYEGKKFLEIKTQKTGAIVIIPVSRIVERLLQGDWGDIDAVFSYQYYNKSIKEIARRAGITGEVVVSRTVGGQRVDVVRKKYFLMSSHTARRSFATNAYLAEVPVLSIMSITGHTTQISFMRYIRCSSLESALMISEHDFFQFDLPAADQLSVAA